MNSSEYMLQKNRTAKVFFMAAALAFGVAKQAEAQRYLSEVRTSYSSAAIKDGLSNLHTFNNGVKLAVEKQGDSEVLVVIEDGVKFKSAPISPRALNLDLVIETKRCKIKIKLTTREKRDLDVAITCNAG